MGYIQEYLEQVTEEQLWEQYLEQCLKRARPYGCRKYFGIRSRTEYIGTLQYGKWLRDVYEDAEGFFWHDGRVMIGGWVITKHECFRGRKDLDNTYEKHTGIPSDWEKVMKRYGGIPPGWEKIRPEDQEEDYADNTDNRINETASGRAETYQRAV